MNEEDQKILFLLAENERAVARLYRSFEAKGPDHAEFWKQLAEEELKHADWVEELRQKVEAGLVTLKKRKFPTEMLEGSIETINAITERAENNALSLSEYSEQLEIAHELEKGMIERKFFKAFETDDVPVKWLLGKLRDATGEHQARIKKQWKQNK